MKHISALLIFVILSGFFPANFALASENRGASVWTQMRDLFSSEKAQSNVEELGGVGGEKEIEQPKLSFSDRISSAWDGFKAGISERFSSDKGESMQDSLAPLPVNNLPVTPIPKPLPTSPAPASSEKEPDAVLEVSSEQSSLWAITKTVIVSGLAGAASLVAAGWTSTNVLNFVYLSGGLHLAKVVAITEVIAVPSAMVLSSGAAIGILAGGALMYSWGGDDSSRPGFISKDTAVKFRKSIDGGYEKFVNLFTLSNKQVDLESPNQPSVEDILTSTGTLQPKAPAPSINNPPVTEPVPAKNPDVSVIGNSINISGFLNLTYYSCGGGGNLGPYQDDWIAKLSKKSDTADLIYSGAVEVVDFMSVGEITVKWDSSKRKWTVSMNSPIFTTSSLSVNFDENLSQGKTSGNISIKTPALDQLGFGSCASGAGNFTGLIVR